MRTSSNTSKASVREKCFFVSVLLKERFQECIDVGVWGRYFFLLFWNMNLLCFHFRWMTEVIDPKVVIGLADRLHYYYATTTTTTTATTTTSLLLQVLFQMFVALCDVKWRHADGWGKIHFFSAPPNSIQPSPSIALYGHARDRMLNIHPTIHIYIYSSFQAFTHVCLSYIPPQFVPVIHEPVRGAVFDHFLSQPEFIQLIPVGAYSFRNMLRRGANDTLKWRYKYFKEGER